MVVDIEELLGEGLHVSQSLTIDPADGIADVIHYVQKIDTQELIVVPSKHYGIVGCI